jgi:hypothetical protein
VRNACVSCVSGKYIDIEGRGGSTTMKSSFLVEKIQTL